MPGRVPPELPDDAGTIARRLDFLFRTVHPASGPYTYEHVSATIREQSGVDVDPSYIWRLRTGRRRNPHFERLAAIAKFFSVPADYFTNDDLAARVDEQLRLMAQLRDSDIRQFAARASELSSSDVGEIVANIAELMTERRKRSGGRSDDGGELGPGAS